MESQFVYIFDEIGRILSRGASFDDHAKRVETLNQSLYVQDVEAFRALQQQQDADDYQSLVEDLTAQAALVNAGFIIASNTFGWAEPGRTSSDDPVPWPLAA